MVKLKSRFDGAVSEFFEKHAPSDLQDPIKKAKKNQIISGHYPYQKRLQRKAYEKTMYQQQIELAKFQNWIYSVDETIVVVFEGRDAAGNGGVIKHVTENSNPRNTHVIVLGKPSSNERGQWYFQRYIHHFPTKGALTFFDRSCYNSAVVERVFEFCTEPEVDSFFSQVPAFEKIMTDDGIKLIKIWLNVSRPEQITSFLSRETDPLKQ